MKIDPTDSQLKKVLATWQVSPAPAPGFKSSVWQRIAAEEQPVSAGFWFRVREFVFIKLPSPAYATAMLALTIGVAGGAASLRASHARNVYRLDQARQYLASIDPMTMAMRGEHASR